MTRRVAIVGAGWAGIAAAVAATQAGHAVTVFEAARSVGGRARAIDGLDAGLDAGTEPRMDAAQPGRAAARLDNGQHILIGAYTCTLALMRTVGIDTERAFERMPLSLRFADGGGIVLPDWPAPWDVLAGVLRARGWSWADKWSLLRTTARWQRAGFRCADETSVADLCAGLAPRPRSELIDPLCVSALNTPADRASGQVFLRVLRDALLGPRGSSHLLLPRGDLGGLLPEPAVAWLQAQGACVRTGCRVRRLQRAPAGDGTETSADAARWRVDDAPFDDVVLACTPPEAARLAALGCGLEPAAQRWIDAADGLRYEAIATVYARSSCALPRPILALRDGADAPAQFVLDRGALCGQHGLLAFVVSASSGDRAAIEAAVLQQARQQLGMHDIRAVQTLVEKRATFACTPGLERPGPMIADHLWACGDFIDGPYPSTLEGAVQSGQAAAARIGRPSPATV